MNHYYEIDGDIDIRVDGNEFTDMKQIYENCKLVIISPNNSLFKCLNSDASLIDPNNTILSYKNIHWGLTHCFILLFSFVCLFF